MSSNTNDRGQQQPRLTYEDATMIWVAREVLRVRAALWSALFVFFLLELLPAVHYGDSGRVLVLIGGQLALVLLVRWALRWVGRHVRQRWQHLVLVPALSVLLTGCQAYGTAIARMYGY